MTSVGATWTSSHVYGDCLINDNKKLFYVNIPKCASSWMKKYLTIGENEHTRWRWGNFINNNLADYQPVIILRDPVKRWLSAAPAVTLINDQNFIKSIPRVFDRISEWMYDEHSALQFDFVNGLNLDGAVFFYCDENLDTNVKHFLNLLDIDPKIVIAPQNVQPPSNDYKLYALVWKSYFDNEFYFNKFKTAYKKDYDLINQVKFYDPR